MMDVLKKLQQSLKKILKFLNTMKEFDSIKPMGKVNNLGTNCYNRTFRYVVGFS